MWVAHAQVLILALVSVVSAIRFDTRCKLVRELLKVKQQTENELVRPYLGQLGNVVCLIEKVSDRNTSAVKVTTNGKKSYGLYQIPDKWCKNGRKGGACNIKCESLVDDDIRDDTDCAVKIFNMEGFKYWPVWMQRCKGPEHLEHYTQEIYKCPDLNSPKLNRRTISGNEVRSKRRWSKRAIKRLRQRYDTPKISPSVQII